MNMSNQEMLLRLVIAAIGLAVGGGLCVPAIGDMVIIFAIWAVLKPVEKRYFESRKRCSNSSASAPAWWHWI